ncbi:hypothetical protein FIS3754_02360 [Fischerella sp. NIES-3754]|nr:hypothetical protein FIS3754_02360 [Fischerella sp. NIES-3754]BCX06782.1 MAG: hypothetical protein KatS3mg066_0641 [Fischerella sp.]
MFRVFIWADPVLLQKVNYYLDLHQISQKL